MDRISCVIVDDDKLSREALANQCQTFAWHNNYSKHATLFNKMIIIVSYCKSVSKILFFEKAKHEKVRHIATYNFHIILQ
jgi:hypothetical protein